MLTKHQALGQAVEQAASLFMQKKGYQVLTQNFRSRFGEIDLIMQKDKFIVFIEVRYRKGTGFGRPVETVTFEKQKKLIQTASIFLQRHPQARQWQSRFDIIGVTRNDIDQINFEWVKNAFYLQ